MTPGIEIVGPDGPYAMFDLTKLLLRRQIDSARYRAESASLPAEVLARLKEFAREEGLLLNHLAAGLFGILLTRGFNVFIEDLGLVTGAQAPLAVIDPLQSGMQTCREFLHRTGALLAGGEAEANVPGGGSLRALPEYPAAVAIVPRASSQAEEVFESALNEYSGASLFFYFDSDTGGLSLACLDAVFDASFSQRLLSGAADLAARIPDFAATPVWSLRMTEAGRWEVLQSRTERAQSAAAGHLRRLRIGNFQAGFPEPDGTTTAVTGLSRALAARGHDVTIYGCGKGSAGQQTPGLGALIFHSQTRNPFAVPRELIARLQANKDQLDLLILNSMFHPSNIAVARAARRGRIPYIVCPHDPYHPLLLRKNRWRKAVYGLLFERPMLRRAAAVQLLSPAHEQHLRAFGIAVPGVTVPNGIHDSDVPAEGPHETLAGDPALLVLGRIDSAHKGQDLLIRALRVLSDRGALPPGLRVHVAGPADDRESDLIHLAKQLRVDGFLEFHGRVPDAVRWSMLRSCDALALCSRYDGFGLVVLEAMLCGRPVLVSDQAGVVDWVRKARCGFDFEPEPVSIAGALEQALAARADWSVMGERGRRFVREWMSWDRMAEMAERQYTSILDQRPLPSPGAPLDSLAAEAAGHGD